MFVPLTCTSMNCIVCKICYISCCLLSFLLNDVNAATKFYSYIFRRPTCFFKCFAKKSDELAAQLG